MDPPPWQWLSMLLAMLGVSYTESADPYSGQPTIMTLNGHLYIMAAPDRNLTLRTAGDGYVNLNGDNLLHVAQMARQASATVSRFEQNLQTNIQSRLNSITRQVSGPHGLASKMAALEQAVYSGNLSSTVNPGGLLPRPSTGIRLNRLGSRVRAVEIQLRNLRNLLTIDECLSNPCRNGGTCQDLFNGFICFCPENWEGTLCDEDVNECAYYAGTDWGCKNGGTCVNKPGSYECLCPAGYFGVHCSLRTGDCSNANSAQLCGHGVCINQGGNGRGYVCLCDEGWEKDVAGACTIDVNECQSKRYPCSHDPHVQCINLPGSFHCGFCPPGYTGNGFQCADLDECEVNNGGCSLVPRVSCINTRGSRVCGLCPPGFSGDGVVCTSVAGGACAINNGGCHPAANCYENAGIIGCRCRDGYAGDGFGPNGCSQSALATHPCHNNPCKNGGTCVAIGTRAGCLCQPHLTGPDCSEVVFASCTPNPCQNNATCSIQNVFGVQQVRCTCPSGFEGARCELMSSECGGSYYQDSGEIQIPSGPGTSVQVYPGGKHCTWRIQVSSNMSITFTMHQVEMEHSDNCNKNYVSITDTLGLNRVFCTLPANGTFTSYTNVATVTFFSTTATSVNRFKLSWATGVHSCGGEFQVKDHGRLQSPGYPQNYPANQNCEWKLIAQPGKKIQFFFSSIDIEASPDCSKDYLRIQEYSEDNEPGNLLAKACNKTVPNSVITHLPAAYVLFHSDSDGSGSGFSITYTVVQGCGGVRTGSSGDITPPMSDVDTYERDQDCEWRIQLPVGDKIKIKFNFFDLEDREICDDYLEVRDGPASSSPIVGRWCGTTIPPPYISSSNTLTIIFHSDFLVGGKGFTIHYETVCGGVFTERSGEIKSPNYPLPYPSEHECSYEIRTPPSTVIQLQFQDFDLEHPGENCPFDYLEIRDGDENSTLIGRYCGDQKPNTVLSSFNYLHLLFYADTSYEYRGFLANYSTIEMPCGALLKESTGMFSPPQNEDGYLPNTECRWMISAPVGWVIQINWLSLHLEYSRDCQMDVVELYENNTATGESTLIDRYCGMTTPASTTSTTNLMMVLFRSDDSVHREGFTANYVMIDGRKVCGGTFRSITGYVESPNYPNEYPSNKICTWVIQVPQGQQIKLKFEFFELEGKSEQCDYDYVQVRNGIQEMSPEAGTFCGSELPPDITSLTNGLWIRFKSDRSSESPGFRATWDATATGCGGTLSSPTGSITSPNYPQPYARDAECYFKISVSQGSKVRLVIVDLDLEPHSKCGLDYIEIYDGLDDRSKSLARVCSSSHPNSILSSQNEMFIKFVSDISFSGRGFHLTYNTECNVTLTSHHGVLVSPNYPDRYPPRLNCLWVIQAPLGNKINVTFAYFELEDSARPYTVQEGKINSECKYDFLEISEGTKNETPSAVLGRYCGNELPRRFQSHMEQVYVHFVTDHYIESTGFHLEWVVSGCGGVIRERPFGKFTSPNYPNGYPLDLVCEWKIIAPWDKSIEITVEDIQLEDMSNCDFDHLAIYGGEDVTAPILMKVCHHQTSPLVYTTNGNHAFVRFQSDFSMGGKGFSASWKFVNSRCGGKYTSSYGEIHSHNYPHNYENKEDCEWLIQVAPHHLINLTFIDFDLEKSTNTSITDLVNVYDGSSVTAPLLLSHSGNSLPDVPYVISTNNTLLVRHKSDDSYTAKGFRAQYAITCGARIVVKGSGTFSVDDSMSASSPWASDNYINCTWYLTAEDPTEKISLTFTFLETSPNSENKESSCSYNYVSVHDGDSNNSTVISRSCGTKLPLPVRSSGSALTVELVSLARSRFHMGRFSALYSSYSTACGGELISEEGVIASPNYPDGYPSNADCTWEIKASVGNKVILSFINLDLEQTEFCNSDFVEVRSNSSSGPLQGVFCGSNLPDNITAANTLWVRFRSDSVNTAQGFMAEYSLVHGSDLVGDTGSIASPLFPLPFIQSGEYKWTVTVSSGKVVRVVFSKFYMDKYSLDDECYMFIQIFDGLESEEGSPSLLKSCGAEIPPPVISTNNVVTVVFNNHPYVHGSYFLLSWEAVSKDFGVTPNTTTLEESLGCGELIHLAAPGNDSVTIKTPNHPSNYGPDLKCSWIIDTAAGFHLKLKFLRFDLEEFEGCDTDFVSIYTAADEEAAGWKPLYSNLCLSNTTNLDIQGGRRIKVYFESDSSEEESGFSAQVTSVCGGTLTDSSGLLNTTKLKPTTSIRDVTCEWQVTIQSGRTIHFTFDSFNLPQFSEDLCTNNYVVFRNGGHKDSPILGQGKYCGSTAPEIPDSTSNRVYIYYNAWLSAPGMVLRYEEVSYDCSHQIVLGRMPNMTISSPNYPQPPTTPHITCTWVVTVPPGERVQLEFVSRFDLKRSPGCQTESLEVRDGGTGLSPLLGTYCFKTPPPLLSQGNRMYIKYFTDADTPNNGFSAVVKIASCGGTYFDPGEVTLRSPQYPSKYPPNLDCVWRIVGRQNTNLLVNVTELVLDDDDGNDCDAATDYIEFKSADPDTKDETGSATRICGKLSKEANGTTLVPPSATNELIIHFRSGRSSLYNLVKRFSLTIKLKYADCYHVVNAPSGTISTPTFLRPGTVHSYIYCGWVITVPEGRRASLKILDSDGLPPSNYSTSNYKLSFYQDTTSSIMFAAPPDAIPPGYSIDSFTNVLKVYYFAEGTTRVTRGFKAQFSSDKPIVCGGEIGDVGNSGFNTIGQNLSFYYCKWTHTRNVLSENRTTFTFSITGSVNKNATTFCGVYRSVQDTIYIRTDEKLLMLFCDDTKLPLTIRSPFTTTSITAIKKGGYVLPALLPKSAANFSISYKTDSCGGIIEGPSAVITSPGFPGPYSQNLDCAWAVNFLENTNINVHFESVDLDVDCTKEFVNLYNGETIKAPHLTHSLCGNNIPSDLISQSNRMFVEFHSGTFDSSKMTRKGFKITLTQRSSGCGGVIHKGAGTINSPNFGTKNYPNNVECDWIINQPASVHGVLSFVDRFSVTTSAGCVNDYIQVFNWENDKWIQIGDNICGRVAPPDIVTVTNKFRVLFRSNSSVTSDGFKLKWVQKCGGVIKISGPGTLTSPNYPEDYFPNLNCTYTLLAPNLKIYAKVEDLHVEGSMYGDPCKYDNVTITTYSIMPEYRFNPWMRQRSLTMVLCGEQLPDDIVSFGKLDLVFLTDPYIQNQGFRLTYTVAGCGGNVTSPTSISNPNGYQFRNCTWYITAPDDKVVVVKFNKIRGYYRMCQNKGLKLFNGHNISNSSSLIENLCYDITRTRYVSTGNKMAINYYADTFTPLIFQAAIGFTYGEKHKCGGVIQLGDVALPYQLTAPDVNGDNKYENFLSCDWLLLAPESHQIEVKFNKVDIQNCSNTIQKCSCDYLEIYDGDTDRSQVLGRYCGTPTLPDITSFSGSLLVHFYSDGMNESSGFQLTINKKLSACGNTIRNATREVQTLRSPSHSGGSQQCLWMITSPPRGNGLLTLKFTDLDLASPCSQNFIEVMEVYPSIADSIFIGASNSVTQGKSAMLCGNRTSEITFTVRNLKIRYVTNGATSHRGFTMEFRMKGCNGNYTAPFGQIIVNKLYQDTSCSILLQMADRNTTISLYFKELFCLDRYNEGSDSGKLIIYDGPSDQSKEVASICSARRPSPIFSSGPALFLKFQTPHPFGQFDATYTSTNKGKGCGGTLSGFTGIFTSPLYPSIYKQDSACRWDVSVPHGNKLSLNFISFDLGEQHTCSSNFIQFYDVDTATGLEAIHSRYCGQDKPATIEMKGDTAVVRYVTTRHNNGTGWQLTWFSRA